MRSLADASPSSRPRIAYGRLIPLVDSGLCHSCCIWGKSAAVADYVADRATVGASAAVADYVADWASVGDRV